MKNIRYSFRRAGIWPFKPQHLLLVAGPADSTCTSILSVAELEKDFVKLQEMKIQEEYRTRALGDDAIINANGLLTQQTDAL